MKIDAEILDDYTSQLHKYKKYINEELIINNYENISKTISGKITEYIESLKEVQNVNELDLKQKIKELFFEYFLTYSESLIKEINNKENIISNCTTKTNNEFEIDKDRLVYEYGDIGYDLDEEKLKSIISKIIDRTMTHINFINRNNLDYRMHEVDIEREVEKIIREKIKVKSEELDQEKFDVKKSLEQKDVMFINYLANVEAQSMNNNSNIDEDIFDSEKTGKTK